MKQKPVHFLLLCLIPNLLPASAGADEPHPLYNQRVLSSLGYSDESITRALEVLGDPLYIHRQEKEEIYQDGKLVKVINPAAKQNQDPRSVFSNQWDSARRAFITPSFETEPMALPDEAAAKIVPIPVAPAAPTADSPADKLVAELKEHGEKKGFKRDTPFNPGILEAAHTLFSGKMSAPIPTIHVPPLSAEVKESFAGAIRAQVAATGFIIENLTVTDGAPSKSQPLIPRARVTLEGHHPTRVFHEEAQKLLAELMEIVGKCCMIGEQDYLGALSTVVTKNPRAKLRYAKSHILP